MHAAPSLEAVHGIDTLQRPAFHFQKFFSAMPADMF
jgi:hypothetical protein